MNFTTKDKSIVIYKDKEVIGLKLNCGPGLVGEKDFKEFLGECSCNLNVILMAEDNQLTCKFYDEETGEIYFHFDKPISYNTISMWFKDEDLIFPLKDLVDT